MSRTDHLNRRTFVQATAATALTGTLLAGCTGTEDGNGSDDESPAEESPTDSSGDGESDFGNWFDDVENYSEVVDETGTDRVTVTVGADGNGGAYAFEPAAVRISAGTTVVWEWTGNGSTHNVVEESGAFESELVGDEGHTFEYTFDEMGTYKYACEPHVAMGMKGGVVVE